MSIREVLFFAERLREQHMHADAFVVNRMHQPDVEASKEQIAAALERRSLTLSGDAPTRILKAVNEERRLGELNRLHLYALEEARTDGACPGRIYPVDQIHETQSRESELV